MQVVVKGIITNYNIYETQNSDGYLVILPGWKNRGDSWAEVAEFLSQKYRVVTLDFPGFGATPKPISSWDIYKYAEFTLEFLKKVNATECVLLGHSFGGRIALVLTGDEKYSQNLSISRLILVNSAGLNNKSNLTKFKIILGSLAKKVFPRGLREHLTVLLGSNDYKNAGEMQSILTKIVNQNLQYLLPKIKTPTLVIWGDGDTELDVKEAKIFHDQIANSMIRIIWGAGHHPHLEKQSMFHNILMEWLC